MRLRNLIILTVIVPLFLVLLVFSMVAITSLEETLAPAWSGRSRSSPM